MTDEAPALDLTNSVACGPRSEGSGATTGDKRKGLGADRSNAGERSLDRGGVMSLIGIRTPSDLAGVPGRNSLFAACGHAEVGLAGLATGETLRPERQSILALPVWPRLDCLAAPSLMAASL